MCWFFLTRSTSILEPGRRSLKLRICWFAFGVLSGRTSPPKKAMSITKAMTHSPNMASLSFLSRRQAKPDNDLDPFSLIGADLALFYLSKSAYKRLKPPLKRTRKKGKKQARKVVQVKEASTLRNAEPYGLVKDRSQY